MSLFEEEVVPVKRTRKQKQQAQELHQKLVFEYREKEAQGSVLLTTSKKKDNRSILDYSYIRHDLKQSMMVSILLVIALLFLYYFELVG